MANINDILNEARIKGCSDVHIGENTGITLRQDGKLIEFEQTFSNEEIKEMILSMCKDRILKIVEKHEAGIKINALQNIICHHRFDKMLPVAVLQKGVVLFPDKFVPF